jgi:hypothetical protein
MSNANEPGELRLERLTVAAQGELSRLEDGVDRLENVSTIVFRNDDRTCRNASHVEVLID